MLHVRIMMRSGGYAASSQNTDADRGAGGGQEFGPRVDYRRSGLTQVCVQGDLNRCLMCKVLRGPSRARSAATKTFKATLKSSGTSGIGRYRFYEPFPPGN